MKVDYKKLFDKLEKEKITQKEIKTNLNFSNTIFDRLRTNRYVTIETIGKLCLYLDCTPNDLVDIIPDANDKCIKNNAEKIALESQIAELQAKLKTLQEGEKE